jgi:hypothetical protein
MTNPAGSMTSRRSRGVVWLRRRLGAARPLLRVGLQVGVGVATLTRHEATVLMLTGIATLLETVQDRYAVPGDRSPDQKLDTPDICAERREPPTMSEAKS